MVAVRQNGCALQYASGQLNRDGEIILEAVKQNGLALCLVYKRLRNDKSIVLEAVKQDTDAIKFISKQLSDDKEFEFRLRSPRCGTYLRDVKFNMNFKFQ
jgi:hypothetical protein